ncbi:MAG: hypothetical protein ACFFEN_13550 [Candidatus Thorarchaeota archaeon]
MSNSSSIISLNITKFPQNLLIPNGNNDVNLQITNNSSKDESYRLAFEGENLDIGMSSEFLKEQIQFAPNETKNVELMLNPTADGYGKLTINVFWLKIVEYVVKVQKIRETVPTSKINKTLGKHTLKNAETIDILNRDDFIITMSLKDLKKSEEQLEITKKSYQSSLAGNSTGKNSFAKVSIEVIDKSIEKIAKGYLSNNNLQKALELALQLSDNHHQIRFYVDLIRVHAIDNLDEVLQIIKKLNDPNLQQRLYKSLVFDWLSIDPIKAMVLTENIDDLHLRIKLIFNGIRVLNESNNTDGIIKGLSWFTELLLTLIKLNNGKKDQKLVYESLKDVIHLKAEVENPRSANAIIELIDMPELKTKIEKDLFNVIYELVDEVKTKIESEVVFSQYFLLNTYMSKISNDVIHFSGLGGNVSNNILSRDYNFALAFLSLFSFDFSILPIIDRVYNDFKFNSNKSIAYYIFPSRENFQNNELTVLTNTLTQFFNGFSNVSNQLLIFNLDFIPYLGKPTVILSAESQSTEKLKAKIARLGESVHLIVDDSMFTGGKIYDSLINIIPTSKCEVVNLILSYEFLNDYNVLKSLIQCLL